MSTLSSESLERLPSAAKTAGTVLIVEDDPRMQRVLHRLFTREAYEVAIAGDGTSALASFHATRPILVILDLVLPEISGRELCRQFKSLAVDTPVIILSAVSDVVDKVLLLELGADDYVTKPFSPQELMARSQASIRRSRRGTSVPDTWHFGSCSIDFKKMLALRDGAPVAMTALEFKLLHFFLTHAERVLTREELLNHVWGYNSYPTTRTVDNLILRLRQKLEQEPAHPKHFLTLHGTGYKFTF